MALDQVLKRHFWIVILALTACAAGFQARAITQIVAAKIALDDATLAEPARMAVSPPSHPAGMHTTSAEPILERNPFDSVTGPLTQPAAQQVSESPPADASSPPSAPSCEGVTLLIVAQSDDPDWSLAAFAVGAKRSSVLRRRGGDVDGKTLEFVGWDRVWLSGPAGRCQIGLFDPAQKAPPPVVAAPSPRIAAAPRGGGLDPAIAKGIQRVSAMEFNIDRGVVDRILENQAELMRQARIVPEQENGRMVGIRLFGVRPDTLLGFLGMQNGDRLQTINGFDMTNPEKALEAYARLRTADHLTVQINRAGQTANLDYNIK